MDLVQNSSSTGLGICSSGSLGVLSADNNRMPSSGYNNNGGPLSPNVSMKQCRSTSEMEVDNGDEGGPLKLARKDSFSYGSSRPPPPSEQTNKLNSPGNNAGGVPALFRSNSFSAGDGGRVTCSPTNSCLSDGVLLGSDAAANLMGHDARMLRNDPGMSAPGGYAGGGGSNNNMRPFSYQSYQYAAAGAGGSPLMLAAAARGDHLGMQSAMGMRGPFTASQWAELEHQALIYKYMMAGASVPPELLHPIRRSVALNNLAASHPSLRMGWGNFHLGIPNNPDPEPGRCRRTDGKKWRCSREVVPDQKYCDRHMHRGRNRSKKNAENQAAAANSQAGGAGAAAAPPSAGNMSVGGGQGSNLNQIHSSLRPPLGMNVQQNQHTSASPYNTNKSYSPHSALPSGIPSNNSASSVQFPLQSLSGASPVANKDYRYMNGMNKADLGLGPEQLLFSDASGSSRGSGQDPHSLMLPSGSWQQNFPSKFPQASQTKFISSSSSPQSMYHSAQQLRSLAAGQQFEANQMSMSQHHQPLLSSGYGGGMDVGRESEEQPLRHFFDDWPRQRDPSTLSWPDMEDEKQSRTSATQLSISSSDFRSPRGKLSLSPLKLSMSRSEEEEQLGGGDPTRMGLGVGLGINHHRQHPWMHNLEGGPLAEVLQSSTPRDCSKSSPGLNLLGDGWESSSRENSRMASPTGVLSKTPFACFSDSSSNASSPRAAHAEAALLANGSKQLTS